MKPVYKSIKEGNKWMKISCQSKYKRNNIEKTIKHITCYDSDDDDTVYKIKRKEYYYTLSFD